MASAAFLFTAIVFLQQAGRILDTPPDGVVRVFRSPDHRYAAVMSTQEGSCAHMRVQDLLTKRYLKDYDDVMNFVWVPGKPHTLLVATDQMYGEGIVAMWDGRNHILKATYPNDGDIFLAIVKLDLTRKRVLIKEDRNSWRAEDGHRLERPLYQWVSWNLSRKRKKNRSLE